MGVQAFYSSSAVGEVAGDTGEIWSSMYARKMEEWKTLSLKFQYTLKKMEVPCITSKHHRGKGDKA